jgi:hypothetical protein
MMPKYDLPALSSYYLLEKISNEKISFISKNSLNIMLTEKFEDYNEQCIKEKINKLTNVNINNKQNIKNIFVNPNLLFVQKEKKINSKKGICKSDCLII